MIMKYSDTVNSHGILRNEGEVRKMERQGHAASMDESYGRKIPSNEIDSDLLGVLARRAHFNMPTTRRGTRNATRASYALATGIDSGVPDDGNGGNVGENGGSGGASTATGASSGDAAAVECESGGGKGGDRGNGDSGGSEDAENVELNANAGNADSGDASGGAGGANGGSGGGQSDLNVDKGGEGAPAGRNDDSGGGKKRKTAVRRGTYPATPSVLSSKRRGKRPAKSQAWKGNPRPSKRQKAPESDDSDFVASEGSDEECDVEAEEKDEGNSVMDQGAPIMDQVDSSLDSAEDGVTHVPYDDQKAAFEEFVAHKEEYLRSGKTCIVVPEQLQWEDWDEVERFRHAFSRRSLCHVVIHNTKQVPARNAQLKNGARNQKHGIAPDYVPEECGPWRRIYGCTHGWKEKNRGTGKRPKQRVLYTGCKWKFTCEVMRDPRGSGQWVVVGKCGFWEHNHPVNLATHALHPKSRKIPEWEPILDDLRLMLRCGGKLVRIYEYIRDQTHYQVRMTDVHNLVAKLRAESTGGNDDVAVADWLMRFKSEHVGNCVSVTETAAGHTGVLSFARNHQRVIFDRFPELLMFDCTHKTNL